MHADMLISHDQLAHAIDQFVQLHYSNLFTLYYTFKM